MTDKLPQDNATPFIQFAPHWTLVASGAMIVFSIALKIVGVDLEPLIDAASEVLIHNMETTEVECVQGIPMVDLSPRIEALESVSHAQGGAK